MVGSIVRIVAAVILLILGVTAPCSVLAQPLKSTSTDDLLKSIGLSKPAMTRAPDFNLRDTNGGIANLSGYRGNLVLVNFWATWCGPCREEMPSLEQLSRNFGGQGFTVLAVNQRENAALVNKFMKTHGLNFTIPLDTDGRVAAAYRVYGIPVTYLIDGNGQALGLKSGPRDWASRDVIEAVRKLIAERGSTAVGGSFELQPAAPMPHLLRAKAEGILLRSQQDALSEPVGKLERAEELVALGKVSGAGEVWYMVKSKSGAMGWVRGAEVEEIRKTK